MFATLKGNDKGNDIGNDTYIQAKPLHPFSPPSIELPEMQELEEEEEELLSIVNLPLSNSPTILQKNLCWWQQKPETMMNDGDDNNSQDLSADVGDNVDQDFWVDGNIVPMGDSSLPVNW